MQDPYNYNFDENSQSYRFTTRNKIDYNIVFVVDETFSTVSNIEINNIYQLIIEKINDVKESYDSQTSATIRAIITEFFKNKQNAIIYICDDSDGKSKQRFKVFDRWYQNSSLTEHVIKIDNLIKYESTIGIQIIYSSLLYHKSNINKETLEEVYYTIQDILNEK